MTSLLFDRGINKRPVVYWYTGISDSGYKSTQLRTGTQSRIVRTSQHGRVSETMLAVTGNFHNNMYGWTSLMQDFKTTHINMYSRFDFRQDYRLIYHWRSVFLRKPGRFGWMIDILVYIIHTHKSIFAYIDIFCPDMEERGNRMIGPWYWRSPAAAESQVAFPRTRKCHC